MNGLTVLLAVLSVYPTPQKIVELGGDFDAGACRIEEKIDASLQPENYRLAMTNGVVEIVAADSDGAFHARQTLAQLRDSGGGRLPNAVIEDGPAIGLRGIVEGYYGRPWGLEGRKSLMDFMGRFKMNLFVYGPKDDPYHHLLWREPYPEAQQEEFRELLAVAAANHIRFYWAIHLGDGFSFGRREDRECLLAKLCSMYELGIRNFAVFFDDFGAADAQAHVSTGNFIVEEFLRRHDGCGPLIVCPNVYWGRGRHEYVKILGEQLDPAALIIWTGRSVCSDILAADTAEVAAAYRRAPLVWWNWPVNDYCRSKVLMGRTYGLETAEFSGFIANPMENCEANKVGIFGVADWSWNPVGFDSSANWESAFKAIYADPEVAAAMRIFAMHNSDQAPNSQGYRREESVGDWNFGEIVNAMAVLRRKLPECEPQLWWELEGWINELDCIARLGVAAENLQRRGGRIDDEGTAELQRIETMRKEGAAKHVDKFKSATFANDAILVVPPRSGTLVLMPQVEKMLEAVK